ncbi:hypothetical protein BDM02DRAFT_3098144 [Thelephora ganbajun]|uniref:Uncharacterized protein n=1 Tax=Thelephora ganbajun TaxID=370292 RepID=A0ACB6ZD60_THEGA|nr:hypothetical protein BDM02DRAFT_3098144 [Thelephora ganbajun]
MPIELPSFYERGSSMTFEPPTRQRGYLPQVNEKLGQWISWDVVQIGGNPHLPIFLCTPRCGVERLEEYAGQGQSKKAAKEKAAEAIALSGHCVCRHIPCLHRY